MLRKSLISSAILAGSLVSTPAFALFWSDFRLVPPLDSGTMAIRSAEGWPDWIGKLHAEFPPAIVEAGSDREASKEAQGEGEWPSWIGTIQ